MNSSLSTWRTTATSTPSPRLVRRFGFPLHGWGDQMYPGQAGYSHGDARAPMSAWKKLIQTWHPQHRVTLFGHGERIRKVFSQLDDNGDGTLAPQEFMMGLQQLGVQLSAHDLGVIMRTVDTDMDGRLDYTEFEHAMCEYKAMFLAIKQICAAVESGQRSLFGIPIDTAADVFRALDQDHNGRISLEEFQRGTRRLDVGMQPHQVRKLFQALDSNGTGGICVHEFLSVMATMHLVQTSSNENFA
eukprot:TRINITY_DN5458_c0_g1_i1.p1 TRINITY_DN5458_c0_g1~~TRINITY_DN5458_c0_g1_i1.p1  ORF type:complete len:244 (-),score=32.14 TRINITY_DN5458_c0_g1_i1:124-855(-)